MVAFPSPNQESVHLTILASVEPLSKEARLDQ